MSSKIVLRWIEPMRFELPRLNRECSVPPPTRAQIRAFYALTPADVEGDDLAAVDTLRGEGLKILCEGSDVPLDELNAEEELQILWAIVARHNGFDAADAVAMQQLLAKKKQLTGEARVASFDEETLRLAAELRKAPGEVDQLPFLDSVQLLDSLAEKQNKEAEFNAALHGAKLQ